MNKTNLETITANITKSFKGVEIKRIPKVGGGWSHNVGSDSYGGKILYVSPDLSWFIGDKGCGFAKLDTRKNSIHYGKYVSAKFKNPEFQQAHEEFMKNEYAIEYIKQTVEKNGKYKDIYKNLKADKTCHCVGCRNHNVRWVYDTPQKDELDPSF